jgi:hypothetical protein
MANKYRGGSRFAEHPLNLTDAERIALAAYVLNRTDTSACRSLPSSNGSRRLGNGSRRQAG